MLEDFPTQASNNITETLQHICCGSKLNSLSFKSSSKYISWRIPPNQPVHAGKTKSDSLKLTPYKLKLLDIFGLSHLGKFNGVCEKLNRITTWVNTKSKAGLAAANPPSV